MTYKLLDRFEGLFRGREFRHRSSNQGDHVAVEFFEDLFDLNRSWRYRDRVSIGMSVLNRKNLRVGVVARRGDGSFGEIVPNVVPVKEPSFSVMRGPIATIEIGIEVKIIQKAMLRQVGRVITDLIGQVNEFKKKKGKPITIGIAGVNHAKFYKSFEGKTTWETTGLGKYKHPYQEADEVERRLMAEAAPHYDEFLILRFIATNTPPFNFSWVKKTSTEHEYGAVLARVSGNF